MHSIIRLGLILAAAFTLTGCQVIWASITSPSDWVSGSSTSLSGSSEGFLVSSGSGGNKGGDTAYLEDVRVMTASLAASGENPDGSFLRDVGRVAESHGVADWEAEASTYRGIGAGLFDAGIAESEIVATLDRLGAAVSSHAATALVLEGFRTASL